MDRLSESTGLVYHSGMERKNRQICFSDLIAGIHKQLGIAEDYCKKHQLPIQEECPEPVPIGKDVFDREQKMQASAAQAWFKMRDTAATHGIILQVVSAFRPVDYQAGIFMRKLDAGQCIEDILKVSAAPGYSEHHSGCALDITTPGFEPLEEEFENSPAFNWLERFAGDHGFKMTYPRNNCHGIAYEPWHWRWANL
jgi:D-alanyl-D-alanine carboxypeptidase